MPLPYTKLREEMHTRHVQMRSYRRTDGRFDIEAHLVDTKPFSTEGPRGVWMREAGAPIHDMWLRLVVDEHLTVLDVFAKTDASPYAVCPRATESLQRLIGLSIGPGWTRLVRKRIGAPHLGCTHLTELLTPMAAMTYQTLWPVRASRPLPIDAKGRPQVIDSCNAYSADGELVLQRWPQHHLQRRSAPEASDR